MYKLIQISDLRVFLDYDNIPLSNPRDIAKNEFSKFIDHNFIVLNTTLRLEVIVNKNPSDFTIPQIRLNFITENLGFIIDTIQVKHMLKAINLINYFGKFQKGVITGIIEEPFTAEDAETYRQLYIQTKTPIKNKEKAEKLTQELQKYEKAKLWDAITQQRSLANKEFELLAIEAATKVELESATSAPSRMSRFTGFFSRQADTSEEEKQEKIEKLKQKLNKINEDRAKLADDLHDLVSSAEAFTECPPDFIRFRFSFIILEFSLKICEGTLDLLKYKVTKPNFNVAISPSYFILEAGIASSIFLDLQDSEAFPHILKSNSFDITVTNQSGLSVSMNSGDLELVLKLKSILRAVTALKEPVADNIDFSQYTSAATDKTKEYIAAGEEYLSKLMTTGIKSSIKLDIHIKAPEILIPLDPINPSKGILVINLGRIDITSKNITLDDNLYDQYTLHLSNFTLFNTSVYPMRELNNSSVILPITLDIILCNSLTDNYSVPNFMLSLELYNLSINLPDTFVKFVLELKQKLLEDLNDIPKPPELPPNLYKQKTTIIVTLIMKFKVAINNIYITLINQNESLTTLEINGMSLETVIKGSESVECMFNLYVIEIRDNREGVSLKHIVCNPILEPVDDEFADAVEELKQITGNLLIANGKTNVNFFMNDLRIVLSHEYCGKMLMFLQFITIEPSKRVEKTSKILSSDIRLNAELSNITLLLPLDTKDLSKRVGLFNISLSLDYNAKKIVEEDAYTSYNESALLQFKKINSVIGIFSNNTVKNTLQKKGNLLNPTQFHINYNKSLSNSELVSEVSIELDKISLDIGFRDVDFASKLAKNWSQIQPPSVPSSSPPAIKEENSPKEPVSPLKLKFASQALEVKLSDDTIYTPIPLFLFSIYQIDLNFAIRPLEKILNIHTRLHAQCFNNNKGRIIPEALFEQW